MCSSGYFNEENRKLAPAWWVEVDVMEIELS
jgi:hypothetical protein